MNTGNGEFLMATTAQIVKAAQELGLLIQKHSSAVKLRDMIERLQEDTEAQRLMTDHNRLVQKLSEKQMNNEPIEVEEKRQLQATQDKVVRHPLLSEFQMVQMDYVDLMRQVDEAMAGESSEEDPGQGQAKGPGLVMPG